MLVKRALHSRRNKYVRVRSDTRMTMQAILTQLALPMLFTLIALIVVKTLPGPQDSPARQLNNLAGAVCTLLC